MISSEDYEAQQSEEQRQNLAAAVIQTRWRQFQRDHGRGAGDGTGDGAGGSGEGGVEGGPGAELSEDEQRVALLDHARALLSDREGLLQQNQGFQRGLAKLFAERRASQGQEAPEPSQSQPADAEAKYWAHMVKVRETRQDIELRRQDADGDIDVARDKHQAILQEAVDTEDEFNAFVKAKALAATFPRSGKPILPKRVEEFCRDEDDLRAQVHDVRIQYIRLRNKNSKLAAQLKEKEKLTDGLHMIDFEQLKIENTNLNEKIEERNEDLLKLRKKATTTIHVLTHVKEKLEFVKAENTSLDRSVTDLEEQLAVLRDRLAHAKKERDVYANDCVRMREKMPMIGAEDLLLDYEVRKKESETLRIEIVSLTNEHHSLMQWINDHQPRLETLQQRTATATAT